MIGRDLAAEVTCRTSYEWSDGSGEWMPEAGVTRGTRRWKVVAYDFGEAEHLTSAHRRRL